MNRVFTRARRGRAAIAVAAVVVAAGVSPAGAATVANGDFETGTLADWTAINAGSGAWFNYGGATSPVSGFPIDSPPQGIRAAITDQGGPGSHILYQDIALEADANHVLELTAFHYNRAGTFITPATLDHLSQANQQFRIDVMDPAAPPDSVDPLDIHHTLLHTMVGDALILPPTVFSVDLSSLAGQTVRLRAAEVDNQFFFQAGIDGVSLSTSFPTTTLANAAIADLVPGAGLYTQLSATVTNALSGAPISGLTVDFSIGGSSVCTGVTDTSGVAACGGLAEQVSAALSGGFTATFAGAGNILGSSDDGPVVVVAGNEII